MTEQKSICVFCSSSDAVDGVYREAARELGRGLGKRGWGLVYGGTTVGLMGAMAAAAHESGAQTVGVIPERIEAVGIGNAADDEHIVVTGMRERKAMMEARADAFVALPGGLGTLEELLEVMTLRQLGYHAKAIVIINTGGFYDPLLALMDHCYEARFAKRETAALFHIADSPAAALDYIAGYVPAPTPLKWFRR